MFVAVSNKNVQAHLNNNIVSEQNTLKYEIPR